MFTSMPRLSVPPEQKEGLVKLSSLGPSELEAFAAALEAAPVKMYQFQLADEVAPRVPFLPPEIVRSVIESVWQVEYMRFLLDAPREPFMADVKAAVLAAGVTSNTDLFMAVLQRLTQAPAITVAAKARALLTDANSYCKSRVLTDLRPVFGESVESPPEAVMVVHHLTLTYHTGDGHRTADVVISLDADDIENLIETLQRAQEKQRRLPGLLDEKKVRYLDTE